MGEGGMGIVYRAHDMNLERTVAVKILNASVRQEPDFIARFRQEARIQAGLNHPNIATLFDFFVWNETTPVAVMEFIEGESVRTFIDRTGPIPAHIALPILIQALHGVAAGHKRGIIHRDLKPSNLMITDEGVVKITDFGIAKIRNNTSVPDASTRVGSPSYMSPEQILGRPVDERTDIYVLGGTLYELLTGHPPFQGLSQFEIDSAHVRDLPKAPTEYCADIPPAAVDAILRALAKEPADRFATAEEFIQALPDLRGVPYVAPVVPRAAAAEPAVAPVEPGIAPALVKPAVAPAEPSVALTERAVAPAEPYRTPVGPATNQPSSKPWRPMATRAASALLLFLLVGVALFSVKHDRVSSDPVGKASVSNDPMAQAPQPNPPPDTPPAIGSDTRSDIPQSATPDQHTRDLTGVWTGTYMDRSGYAELQLLNLHLQQAATGDITGRFIYKTSESPSEECTLDKSSYSTQTKRLRLIIHCPNPGRPKYFNVPLDFDDVDPAATTIGGGRLAFHLADDVVVTLARDK